MESLGFGFAELSEINPRLIAVESSAFGATGPWSKRMGYGPLVRAAAGLTRKWCYLDDADGFSDSGRSIPTMSAHGSARRPCSRCWHGACTPGAADMSRSARPK